MAEVGLVVGNDPETERWNYRPVGQVGLNPVFSWPPRPGAVVRWYRGAWLQITAVSVPLMLALILYFAILPPLEAMKTFAWGWVATIWAMNVGGGQGLGVFGRRPVLIGRYRWRAQCNMA